MNPITVFQLASWTIGLWDYWLVGIEAGAGPISSDYAQVNTQQSPGLLRPSL